jgi:hypothetical protein
MMFALLRLIFLFAAWWAALWFVLPFDLDAQTVPELVSLVSWHLAPPLLVVVAWSLFKRVRVWRANKKAKAQEDADKAAKEAELAEARATRERELELRRVHVECRGAWVSVPDVPPWNESDAQCSFLEEDTDNVYGAGRAAALTAAAQGVFESVLAASAAVAWLPVYAVPDRRSTLEGVVQQEVLQRAWRSAIEMAQIESAPSRSECNFLPGGGGSIIDRVIALFNNDLTLPALLLVGMDSPMADVPEKPVGETPKEKARPDRPGHAVAVVLLSRPGLALPDGFAEAVAREGRQYDAYTPFWEREQEKIAVQGIGRVPLPLQPDLLSLLPFAALTRPRLLTSPRARQIPGLLKDLMIDAGLNDPPPVADAADKGGGAEEGKAEEPKVEEPEFGWLVHNSGSVERGNDPKKEAAAFAASDRMTNITLAIRELGGKVEAVQEASNLGVEHGDVGAAQSVLMLAEGLIRTKQLQKLVVIAEYDESWSKLEIGISRPVKA